jgi:hypothetical protein
MKTKLNPGLIAFLIADFAIAVGIVIAVLQKG